MIRRERERVSLAAATLVYLGSAGDHRHRGLLAGGHVVDQLDLCVREPERLAGAFTAQRCRPLAVALAYRRDPRSAVRSAHRSLAGNRGAHGAERGLHAAPGPRSFAKREIELRPEPVACRARVDAA